MKSLDENEQLKKSQVPVLLKENVHPKLLKIVERPVIDNSLNWQHWHYIMQPCNVSFVAIILSRREFPEAD